MFSKCLALEMKMFAVFKWDISEKLFLAKCDKILNFVTKMGIPICNVESCNFYGQCCQLSLFSMVNDESTYLGT